MIAAPRVRRNSHRRHHQDSERTEGLNWSKSLNEVIFKFLHILHFRNFVFLIKIIFLNVIFVTLYSSDGKVFQKRLQKGFIL